MIEAKQCKDEEGEKGEVKGCYAMLHFLINVP